jgi:hypothetical protein
MLKTKVIIDKFLFIFLKLKIRIFQKIIFSFKNVEDRFTMIYYSNYWKDKESSSGTGSNLKSTKMILYRLPLILKKFKIKKVVDAPCGDFNWMSRLFITKKNIYYTGIDVVQKIVDLNNSKYSSKYNKIIFIHKNIIVEKLPNADLLINRDFLFHLSYSDIFKFLKNFINSKIKFILISGHNNQFPYKFKNYDVKTGDFRFLDLFSYPFFFKKNYLTSFFDKDFYDKTNSKMMYLYTRKQIKSFFPNY